MSVTGSLPCGRRGFLPYFPNRHFKNYCITPTLGKKDFGNLPRLAEIQNCHFKFGSSFKYMK